MSYNRPIGFIPGLTFDPKADAFHVPIKESPATNGVRISIQKQLLKMSCRIVMETYRKFG